MKLRINRPGRRFVMGFAALLLPFLTACEQDYELELPLAVTQNSLTLDPSGGQTHVLVYATGGWSAEMASQTPWASLQKASGDANGEFIFTYEINPGIDRKADVVIRSAGREQVITMIQKGFVTEAEITLMKQSMEMPCWAGKRAVALKTNMGLALERFRTEVGYLDAEGAEIAPEQPWVSDILIREDSVFYTVAANTGTDARTARLTLRITDEVNDKVYASSALINQSTEEGFMRFEEDAVDVESFARTNASPWQTNLSMFFGQIVSEVEYADGSEPWITDVVCGADCVTFNTAENTTRGTRDATLRLTYKDEAGHLVTTSQKITQARPALEQEYAELRALLASAGSVTLERDFILGVVVGSAGHENMDLNPNLTYNTIDFTVNDKTNYIQSLDGRYGFRIQTPTEADNTLERYSTVKIALAGLTLVREDDPVRYTLAGFTAGNVLEATPGTAATPVRKAKHVAELTDDDLFTFVSLQQVEIASSLGAYTNCHDGYLLKTDLNTVGRDPSASSKPVTDCIPRLLRDDAGSMINMLFNTKTRWRKGKSVPRGAGEVSGILVHDRLSRYGKKGDVGRYQLRPIEESDIRLGADVADGFATTLAEWDWNKTKATNIDAEKRIQAHTGSGYITSSVPTTAAMTPGFAGTAYASNVANSALRYNAKWWNFATNQGEWVSFSFSTADIQSRNLSLVFTCGLGNQAASSVFIPTFWDVKYSTDGVNFTTLEQLTIHPIVINASKGVVGVPGLMEFAVNLPDELFGQPNVTVRLQAASTVCSTIDGDEDDGVLTAANIQTLYLRFGSVTIKYNK